MTSAQMVSALERHSHVFHVKSVTMKHAKWSQDSALSMMVEQGNVPMEEPSDLDILAR